MDETRQLGAPGACTTAGKGAFETAGGKACRPGREGNVSCPLSLSVALTLNTTYNDNRCESVLAGRVLLLPQAGHS